MNQALAKAVQGPKVNSQLTDYGYEIVGFTPKAFASHVDAELVR